MSAPPRSKLLTFYTLLVTQSLSLIGSRMTAVAIGIWIFNETGQTAPLLLTSFFTELPGMLGGSLAGVLVDRWNRKLVLILADAGQGVGSLLLLISFQSGAFQLWHLYAVAFLQGTFSTLQGPAESATITLLIPEHHRERANAIHELAFPLAGILAPVLTGLIYTLVGVTGVITLDLGTFFLAAGVATVLSIPPPPVTSEGQVGSGHWLAELRTGLRYFQQRWALLMFVLYLTFINFMLNGPLDLTIPYLIAITGSETQVGFGLGLMSLGAFVGGGLMMLFGGVRPRVRVIVGGMVLTGLMFLVYGTARSFWGLSLSVLVLMIPLPMMNAVYKSILQVKTPPDLQGRVFAVVSQFYMLGSTTSFLLTGPLVDQLLEPAVGQPAWGWVAPLVGSGPGSGMGLLLCATGIIILTATGLTFSQPVIRHLEANLPDYQTGVG